MNKQLIAHRGESYDAPENTLASINLAWKNGAPAVEIDIRLTKDNKIVVIHDRNTWRVSKKFKYVHLTRLRELQELDVGILKNVKYKGERIPTLEDILNTVPNNRKIFIEIKSNPKIIPYLISVINVSGVDVDQIKIISFSLRTLIEVKRQLPACKVFWIRNLDYYWIRKIFPPSINRILKKALKYNINGLDLWAGNMLNHKIIMSINTSGLKLYVWTINNPEKALTLLKMNIEGVTTDRFKWLNDHLNLK